MNALLGCCLGLPRYLAEGTSLISMYNKFAFISNPKILTFSRIKLWLSRLRLVEQFNNAIPKQSCKEFTSE